MRRPSNITAAWSRRV